MGMKRDKMTHGLKLALRFNFDLILKCVCLCVYVYNVHWANKQTYLLSTLSVYLIAVL